MPLLHCSATELVLPGAGSPWFVVPEPRPGAAMRLVCFPYAGGAAGAFTAWLPLLPDFIELVAVQLPGRGGRASETPWTCLDAMADGVSVGIEALHDRPLAFFGHSMGALLAFEVIRRLRRSSAALPVALYASAFSAPQLLVAERLLWRLSDDQLRDRLCELGGAPDQMVADARLMKMMLPVLRADIRACDSYIYRSEDPLDTPIVCFGGMQDRLVSGPALAAWEEQTSGSFTMRMLPGGHFFWSSDGALPLLLWTLTRQLSEIATKGRSGNA